MCRAQSRSRKQQMRGKPVSLTFGELELIGHMPSCLGRGWLQNPLGGCGVNKKTPLTLFPLLSLSLSAYACDYNIRTVIV